VESTLRSTKLRKEQRPAGLSIKQFSEETVKMENASFMVAYLKAGGRLGLGSRRAHALLLGCVSETTPLCRGEN